MSLSDIFNTILPIKDRTWHRKFPLGLDKLFKIEKGYVPKEYEPSFKKYWCAICDPKETGHLTDHLSAQHDSLVTK